MSQEERDCPDWLKRAQGGSMSQQEAAEKMGVSARWVHKLLSRMTKRGDAVVIHGLRGRPPVRKRKSGAPMPFSARHSRAVLVRAALLSMFASPIPHTVRRNFDLIA